MVLRPADVDGQSFTDAETGPGEESIWHSIQSLRTREELLDVIWSVSVLALLSERWQVYEFMIPRPGINRSAFIIHNGGDHDLDEADDFDDGLVSQALALEGSDKFLDGLIVHLS